MKRPSPALLGATALAGYAIHGAAHLRQGTLAEMLWMCNVASLLVGAGLLLHRRAPLAIGVSWLVIGDILWILDLLGGGELLPTSLLTHALGLAVGIEGLRRLGFPARTWPLAALGFAALQELSRWVTPAALNVNVAFSIYPGGGGGGGGAVERFSPSYGAYRLAVIALAALAFALVEIAAVRLFPRGTAPAACAPH